MNGWKENSENSHTIWMINTYKQHEPPVLAELQNRQEVIKTIARTPMLVVKPTVIGVTCIYLKSNRSTTSLLLVSTEGVHGDVSTHDKENCGHDHAQNLSSLHSFKHSHLICHQCNENSMKISSNVTRNHRQQPYYYVKIL